MTSNFPKRQHYIPQVLLKHFCDNDGRLWAGNKGRNNVFRTRPLNVFVRNNIYTRYAYDDDTPPSAEYEQGLCRLESDAGPVIDRIVGCVRRSACPVLAPDEQTALQRFLFSQALRTPESQQRVSSEFADDDLYDIVEQHAQKVGFAGLPDKEAFFDDNDDWSDWARRLIHNSDAGFAAGDDPHIREQEQKFIAETGIRFAVTLGPGDGFIIGSHGFTHIEPRPQTLDLAGAVLPIAHDVLAHVTPWPYTPSLLILEANKASSDLVGIVNRATVAQSLTIAGRSETLIRSMLD